MKETMNNLVVAIYARAAMDREETGVSDLSVAESKIKNNIVQGLPLDPVGGIPLEYIPDWQSWHTAYETLGAETFGEEWAKMNALRKKLWEPLYQLFGMKKFDEMVEIMENPPADAALDKWPKDWDGVRPAKSELPEEPEAPEEGETEE